MLPEMVGQRRLILSAVDELRPLVSLSPVDRRLKRVPETNPEANSESRKPEDDWWEVLLARTTGYRLVAVDELRPLVSRSLKEGHPEAVAETNQGTNSESTKPEGGWWEVVLARMTRYRRPIV